MPRAIVLEHMGVVNPTAVDNLHLMEVRGAELPHPQFVGRIAENLFHKFEQLGIEVLIADMPTYNGKDRKDVMIRQIREAIAEENRKDIIERLWKGRQERVRRGLPPGGNIPYGYRRNAAGLIRHEAEAAVVRRIFERSARGETKSAIARALEAEGLLRRNGKPWTRRQVGAILTRAPLYREGVLRYGEAIAKNDEWALVHDRSSADG
ncbi:MAG: recombinase family protein [Vicinamibacteria bacterium]